MFCPVKTADFPKMVVRYQNRAWAEHLGLGEMAADDSVWCRHFARFKPIAGSLKLPLALTYHGHQFGVYNPDLGDGRGILFAQCEDPADGRLLDFGTKGSGQTPFSRGADGRLTLKGAVREILATEMLEALGVNTSKTFSVIETGEALTRHDEPSPTRSAVLVRLSHSHIRIGSFQRLAYSQDTEMIETLLRYVAQEYFRESLDPSAPAGELAAEFVRALGPKMAQMVADWMAAGFVHGVLNTDNFNVTGESFDYGPWRFLPHLTPSFTAAYFDYQGRYAYGRQPEAAFWALCRLADCFVDLSGIETMQKAVGAFQEHIASMMTEALCRRLGIDSNWDEAEKTAEAFIKSIKEVDVGFEAVIFDWYGGEAGQVRALAGPRKAFYMSENFAEARELLAHAPMAEGVDVNHPYFQRQEPETMLIDEVEAIWSLIAEADDWSQLRQKIGNIHLMAEAYGGGRLSPRARVS